MIWKNDLNAEKEKTPQKMGEICTGIRRFLIGDRRFRRHLRICEIE